MSKAPSGVPGNFDRGAVRWNPICALVGHDWIRDRKGTLCLHCGKRP